MSKKSTTKEFIEKAKKIHGDRYDYSKVDYKNNREDVIIGCLIHGDFPQRPDGHLQGHGCPKCTHIVSKPSQEWLDSIGIPNDKEHREVSIYLIIDGKKKKYIADGLKEKTIYEWYGDYYHGNPNNPKFPPDNIHPRVKKTYGELYAKTLERTENLRVAGWAVVEMWESDWIKISKMQ